MTLAQLPQEYLAEVNPFAPLPPESIRAVSPDLYDFLRELSENVREQHNRTQTGDTTFNWQMMLQVDETATHIPGSLGSFYHPDFGLIRGRYVQFTSMAALPAGSPVGRLAGLRGLTWRVTNDESSATGLLGLAASFTQPTNDSFGWIVTEGVNLSELTVSKLPPEWNDSPIGKYLGGAAEVVSGGYKLAAGTVRVGLEATGGSSGVTSGANPATNYDSQLADLRYQIGLTDAGNKLTVEILGRRVTQLSRDVASVNVIDRINAAANFANIAGVYAAEAGRVAGLSNLQLNAVNQISRDVQAYRTEAGYYAVSSSESRNEAALKANDSQVSADASAVSSTQALAYRDSAGTYAASAQMYSELAASYSRGAKGLTPNGDFTSGGTGWVSSTFTFPVGPDGRPIARSTTGMYSGLTQMPSVRIDPLRTFRLHARWRVSGVDTLTYIGFGCQDDSGAFLGNVYAVNSVKGTYTIDQRFGGVLNYGPTPVYVAGEGTPLINFPTGTTQVYLLGLFNYPNPGEAAGVYCVLDEFWFEDVTSAQIVDARLTTLNQVRVDAETAIASSVSTLTTTVNSHTSTLTTYGTSISGLSSKWGVRVNTDGYITGIELNSGASTSDFVITVDKFKMVTPTGNITPFEVDSTRFKLGVDLHMGTHRIIADTGSVMLVQGVGFGSSNQFLEWFGPSMSVSGCSESTALTYKKTDGSGYFGGTLNAGIITNNNNTTVLSALTVSVGPFTSAGHAIQIVCGTTFQGFVDESVAWNETQPTPADPYTGSHTTITLNYRVEISTDSGTTFGSATTFTITSTTYSQIDRVGSTGGVEPKEIYRWRRRYITNGSNTRTVTPGSLSTIVVRLTRYAGGSPNEINRLGITTVEQ